MKQIQTTRFGTVQYNEEHLIVFPDGMVGFHQLKTYILVESPQNPFILWLQSTDHGEIAFPVVEPWFFKTDYKLNPGAADKCTLSYEEGDLLKTFVVLTIPQDLTRMTVNLKAPVVVNLSKARATQSILQDRQYEVRTPAFEAFSKALSAYQLNDSSVEQSAPGEDEWSAVNVKGRIQQSAAEAGV